MDKILNIAISLLLFLVISSCSSKKEVIYLQDIEKNKTEDLIYISPTIQPNDILRITIGALIPETAIPYNMTSVQGVQVNSIDIMKLEGYLVDSEYHVLLPVLGKVSVKDKTTKQLEDDIKYLLEKDKHLVNPTVNVRFLNAKVTILGEVNTPGTFNFTEERLTFLQALGLAGDLTINGKREDVLLIREVDNKRQVSHIDLTQSNWLNSDSYYIKPNDVIVVNPNIKKVKSSGIIGDTSTVIGVASLIVSITILLTR